MSETKKTLSPRQLWALLGILISLVIGLGYWWYTTLVWEEKEIDLGYSKEAKQNDYLAAEIFLRKQGVQATSIKNLSLLDKHSWRNIVLGAQDTIVLINGNKTLTSARYDSLYEWIENGGTFITSTRNPFVGAHTDQEDLLLRDFNITPAEDSKVAEAIELLEKLSDSFDDEDQDETEDEDLADTNPSDQDTAEKSAAEKNTAEKSTTNETNDKKSDEKKTKQPANYRRCNLKKDPTELHFSGEDQPLRFDFSRRDPFIYHNEYADDEDDDEVTDEDSEEQIESENSDDDEAEYNEEDDTEYNDEDEDYDSSDDEDEEESSTRDEEHHLLYFDIGEGSITVTSDNSIWSNRRIDCHDHAYGLWSLINTKGRVWFLINQDAPSLSSIIWHNASYGVLAALIALILWLWAQSARFGPVLVVSETGRRSLAEHIYASAMLLWRKQQHPQLLNLLRTEVLTRLEEQHPNLDQASGAARIEFLQQLTGIHSADIQQALFAEDLQQPQAFATAIAHLQTIRKQL